MIQKLAKISVFIVSCFILPWKNFTCGDLRTSENFPPVNTCRAGTATAEQSILSPFFLSPLLLPYYSLYFSRQISKGCDKIKRENTDARIFTFRAFMLHLICRHWLLFAYEIGCNYPLSRHNMSRKKKKKHTHTHFCEVFV